MTISIYSYFTNTTSFALRVLDFFGHCFCGLNMKRYDAEKYFKWNCIEEAFRTPVGHK